MYAKHLTKPSNGRSAATMQLRDSGHCVNPNHIVLLRRCKLLEGVNANFVWDKCVVHLIVDAVIGVFLA